MKPELVSQRVRSRSFVASASLALSLGITPSASAQAPEAANVWVDAASSGTPLEPIWPFFGFDEINYGNSPEGKQLLGALATANRAPVHIRNHFLFNTGDGSPALKWGSTNVYTEDGAGNPVYSWALTDGIMDAITGSGALPFVELGFMPQALSTHPDPYRNSSPMTLDGGSVYPPTDYSKWASLVRNWAMHADARYPNVARGWLWELWNEPDIGYWNGTFEEYTTLYDYTESALHDALPDAPLGGPAVAGPAGTFFRHFLEHCATGTNAVTGGTGTRLDLVSFHAKGGVALSDDHVEMNLGGQLKLHRAGFAMVAAFPSFKTTPIYVTEADPDGCAACPVSSTPADAYRTSPAYGAYELAMMKHSIELEAELGVKLGGLLTWAFTFPGTPYFSGYRALTTNGIDLPVLGAFKLLGRLSGTRLPLTSSGAHALDDLLSNSVRDQPEIDGIATRDGSVVQVLVWNYHDELVTVPATPVQLTIQLPANFGERVRVSHSRVDESHGDAYTTWLAQGSPAQPSSAQVQALQQSMAPGLLEPDKTLPLSSSGSVVLDFNLPRFGVSLVTLQPAAAGSDSSAADDSSPSSGCACHVGALGHTTPKAAWIELGAMALFAIERRRRGLRRRDRAARS